MNNAAEKNPYLPKMATIKKIISETGDVKSFQLVFDDQTGKGDFQHKPGQVAMLSFPGAGEAMISITSSPTYDYLEFSVKKVGRLTSVLHQLEEGSQIGVRGPYGNWFPYEQMRGKDLLFIGGGIGLAPLRSLINFILDEKNRKDYGQVEIIYGARSREDLCFKEELFEKWPKKPATSVYVTIDRPEPGWEGHVAFVPAYLEELNPLPGGKYAITCGPPIMIKFVLAALKKMAYRDEQVITTLEMKMKCGIGKCGRCNIGNKFVCVDGPVFFLSQLNELPPEF